MMNTLNTIGLNSEKSAALVTALNQLLSSYQIQYMNARGFHWNIKGKAFFELHTKFEEHYITLLEKVDEIAERILTIEGKPLHTFSDYIEQSQIAESQNITDGSEAVSTLLDGYSVLIKTQRQILSQAADAEDEGTAALMSDYIKEQEKLVWMLKAYLD